jgi:hypothetical protein
MRLILKINLVVFYLDKSDLSDVAKVFKPLETLMNVSATSESK